MIAEIASHYEIVEKIGEGGMGEVFKARDTRLNRLVAIKTLAAGRNADPVRRARFLQEARAASSLNHPNIVAIYDVVAQEDCDYLIMEYVSGETLAAKIARKELRLSQALRIGAQIAEGLARAHSAGIIHRDLKPANVMIAEDGSVKLLDFGLAKVLEAPSRPDGCTETLVHTVENAVLGTAGYMSPEQVRGRDIDHRSDIFSFGVVLYEMLSGRRAFQGESAMDVMTNILADDPPPLSDSVPWMLRQLVASCLEKERSARFESARDLAVALRALETGLSSAAVPLVETDLPQKRKRILLLALGSVAVATVAVLAAYALQPKPVDLSSYRFTPFATESEPEKLAAWSPDGKSVAYLKLIRGREQVMIRGVDAPAPSQLTSMPEGVNRQSAPFFSPDGERIYFIASGALWSVAAVGGDAQVVLREPALAAAISPDGKALVYWKRYDEAGLQYASVWVSSPIGARPRPYTPAPFRVKFGFVPDYLRFSPDGSRIALSADRISGAPWVWVLPWPDGAAAGPRQVFAAFPFGTSTPAVDWMPNGRDLVFAGAGNLWLGDTGTGELRQLTAIPIGIAKEPAISKDGSRLLFTIDTSDYDTVEVPVDGSPPKSLVASSRNESSPSWSNRGRLAFITDRAGYSEIWLRDAVSGWERPIVRPSDFPDSGPEQSFAAVSLSPDGSRVAYWHIGRLWVSSAMGGRPSPLAPGSDHYGMIAAWSPDGSSIAHVVNTRGSGRDLVISRVGSQNPPFLVPDMRDQCSTAPTWSPDGRWIACGDKSSSVVLLVSPDGKQRLALRSPTTPDTNGFVLAWAGDSRAIYVAASDHGDTVLDRVELSGSTRRVANYGQTVIFGSRYNLTITGSPSPDGKSFATTAINPRSDLWMIEGLQQGRRWFGFRLFGRHS